MLKKAIKALPVLALAGLLAGCGAHHSSQGNVTMASPPGTVVATVNGEAITEPEINAYVSMRTHGQKIHLNNDQKRDVAKGLTQILLAAQEARKAKLDQTPEAKAAMILQENLYLANAAVHHYLSTHSPSESTLHKEYETLAKAQSGKEYKARHILVKTKAEAERIINELNHGANFAALAKKYSTGPSAKQGGELGWFKPDQMVPSFSAAVEKLKPGTYTRRPVKTRFGWHIIELQKERTAAPPSYTAMKPTLINQAKNNMVEAYLKKLQDNADVKMKLPESSTSSAAKSAGSQSSPAPGKAAGKTAKK